MDVKKYNFYKIYNVKYKKFKIEMNSNCYKK